MIPTLLILSCLAPTDEPVRLKSALGQMNRMVASCHQTDNACVAYIYQSDIVDKAYKVRLKVDSVDATPDEKTTIIYGTVRMRRADRSDYRTKSERQAIRESLTETREMKKRHERERKRERVRQPGPASPCDPRPCRPLVDPREERRRQNESRARKEEHRHLLRQLNQLAEDRKSKIENIALKILDDEHYPQDYEIGKTINCIVRIETITLRPKIEGLDSSRGIQELTAQLEEVTLKNKS